MLGSHLDTVRDAGRYDGMLGVISAIECVDALNRQKKKLPFAIELIGFGDEEGVRFGTTLLGSRAIAGTLAPEVLETKDAAGTSIAQALLQFGLNPEHLEERKSEVLAYAELHIEQARCSRPKALPLGVVTAINGFSAFASRVAERGGAGTVPSRSMRAASPVPRGMRFAVEQSR
jgi:allantoate deiminase